jgi:hypothetical protein
MGLTKAQEAALNKVRAAGSSDLAVSLDDGVCSYLVCVIAKDLGLTEHFPECGDTFPPFFGKQELSTLRSDGFAFRTGFERLVALKPDADTYFYCLATLHKARLKYERILQSQAIPTIDQVGPRGLLQYGGLSPTALAGLLFWRKWLYDIDNRAAQETGYVFQPVIAHAVGGVTLSHSKSPIRRRGDASKGREVDCLLGKRAYEIKLRVTIAASGQGRWGEELDFPLDCKASGYQPVLVVLDPTPNPKIEELKRAFLEAGGEAQVGDDAWKHLENTAGETMGLFIERYVRVPIQSLLTEAPITLPDLRLSMVKERIVFAIGEEKLYVRRGGAELATDPTPLPEDVDDALPGP